MDEPWDGIDPNTGEYWVEQVGDQRVEAARRQHRMECTGPGPCHGCDLLAARAQAEREREDEIVKLRADVVWIAQQRDENEQWARDRAAVAIQMADERDAARAEVERLKGDNQIQGFELSAAHGHQEEAEKRAEQAEAALARVREILTGACARYGQWYLNGASCEADNMAYELVSAMRAALEGR